MRSAITAGRAIVFACVLGMPALVTSSPLRAQQYAHALATLPSPAQDTARQSDAGWTTLRVAKWATAAVATGLAVHGVINNRQADDRFEELEQLCVVQPARCDEREPDGSYSDAELENRYQRIRELDSRARTSLLAGQVGIAASVLLFVLDLRNSDGPENIPYEPRTFDAGPSRDGGLQLQLNLRVPGNR